MKRSVCWGLLVVLALPALVVAQDAATVNPRTLGTSASGFTSGVTSHVRPNLIGADLYPTFDFTSASYGTGGVALRNRANGDIQISGLDATSTTQAAYLYWAVLLNTSSPSKSLLSKIDSVDIARQYPTGGTLSAKIKGTLLAVGGDPCWGSSGVWVYRGSVPSAVATGNGVYKITLNKGASGLTDGEDPWDGNVVYPLFEGASLVIVGTGSAWVGVFDTQAGTTFGGASYYYNYYGFYNSATSSLITPTTQVLYDNIGYDGQIGASRTINYYYTNEYSYVVGEPSGTTVEVAGPGGETGDSDWDGSSGVPLPQLWDDTGHDVTNAFLLNSDDYAEVYYSSVASSPYDCIGDVAGVFSVE